ncbi:hypothetical protein F5Y16DRAFT_419616 [Xylariaceae sp. FL0255]|nr:hypothetical protein F5Y16DRAFT_419616 [Xylariaceae sp. FL0255]
MDILKRLPSEIVLMTFRYLDLEELVRLAHPGKWTSQLAVAALMSEKLWARELRYNGNYQQWGDVIVVDRALVDFVRTHEDIQKHCHLYGQRNTIWRTSDVRCSWTPSMIKAAGKSLLTRDGRYVHQPCWEMGTCYCMRSLQDYDDDGPILPAWRSFKRVKKHPEWKCCSRSFRSRDSECPLALGEVDVGWEKKINWIRSKPPEDDGTFYEES